MARTGYRRGTALAAVATAAALALTGCGGAGNDGRSNSSNGGPIAPGPNGARNTPAPYPDDTTTRPTGMTDPARDPLSTFALDIDTGSYTRFRDAVGKGTSIAPSEVRTEEFVNYFRQDYRAPREGLDVSLDAAALPFREGHRLVRVGISSAPADSSERADADLTLVVDCSGSMNEAGKLGMTKAALSTLVTALRPSDRVAMVCYSTDARVVLEPTTVGDRRTILRAVDRLEAGGSTNAESGLTTGYRIAADMAGDGEGRMSRVILISDGVANVGDTSPDGILGEISARARAGTNLVSVGVGISTYNDHLLEQLADRGDGWHVYVDNRAEAEKVFATGLTGTLAIAARDAKAQVTFDPEQVAGYRLIGYENRAVADEDFRNDAVDGGEVFAGHTVTALYDVELRGQPAATPFVTATVRYQDADRRPVERTRTLRPSDCAAPPSEASARLQQDLVIAMLTDHLTAGPWSRWVTGEDLRAEASQLSERLDGDAEVARLVGMVDRVAG